MKSIHKMLKVIQTVSVVYQQADELIQRNRSNKSEGKCREKRCAYTHQRLWSNSGALSILAASHKHIICISSSLKRNHKQMRSVGRDYGTPQRKITFYHPQDCIIGIATAAKESSGAICSPNIC